MTTSQIIRPTAHLLAHPAAKAWRALQPQRLEPTALTVLKERPQERRKSAVYRLEGLGPAGAAVIAKRCRRSTATIERIIYEEILPHMPIPTLRTYGYVEEPDGEAAWLFLECAGGLEYSPLSAEQRAASARWLGHVHASAARAAAHVRLPDRGPGHYLEHLRLARTTIVRHLANPVLSADDRVILTAIVGPCHVLERRWGEVEECCAAVPRTLVHGDFVGKNLRVQPGRAGMALLCFDWEHAGWGVAAADLAQSASPFTAFAASPDLATYWSVIHEHWARVDLPTVQRLADCGKTLRCLAAIDWEAQNLGQAWAEWPMRNLRIYHAWLAHAIQAAGWRD